MRSQDNITELSEKDSVNIINSTSGLDLPHYNLETISKAQTPNLTKELFTDDEFKLSPSKDNQSIRVKRLSELYPHNVSLFIDLKTGNQLTQPTLNKINMWSPTYLSEFNMLPFRHWCKLIEPPYINEKGFYYVVVCQNGTLTKVIIDDKFYFDEKDHKIFTHPALSDHPWVHIVAKVWAKLNKGYDNLKNCPSFSFIRTFSFPDWEIMNPNKQRKQIIIAKLTKATSKSEYLIAKTKDDLSVGYFGFGADCASYVISGHYQQYGDIYVKIVSYTVGGWNSHISQKSSHPPEQVQDLKQNEFLMPIQEFLNVFHLIYSTYNKYGTPMRQDIYSINYHKYSISIDALSKSAVVIGLDVVQDKTQNQSQYQNLEVAISFFFPHIKVFDLIKNEHSNNELDRLVVPWSKIMVGRAEDYPQDSYQMEVMKQGLIKYNSEGLMSFNIHKNNHQYVYGNFFKGYANEFTHSLSLRPGKYYIRLKVQQNRSEYHCFVTSVVINGTSKFYDPRLKYEEQISFLEDCLFRKAVKDKKDVTFINPAKRGSWISCRDEKETLGYSYIAVHVVKNADNKIIFKVNPSILKEHGYIVKQHKDMKNFQITIDSEENTLIIFKHDKDWKGTGKRIWPPPGIQFRKIPRQTNNNRLSERSSKNSL